MTRSLSPTSSPTRPGRFWGPPRLLAGLAESYPEKFFIDSRSCDVWNMLVKCNAGELLDMVYRSAIPRQSQVAADVSANAPQTLLKRHASCQPKHTPGSCHPWRRRSNPLRYRVGTRFHPGDSGFPADRHLRRRRRDQCRSDLCPCPRNSVTGIGAGRRNRLVDHDQADRCDRYRRPRRSLPSPARLLSKILIRVE